MRWRWRKHAAATASNRERRCLALLALVQHERVALGIQRTDHVAVFRLKAFAEHLHAATLELLDRSLQIGHREEHAGAWMPFAVGHVPQAERRAIGQLELSALLDFPGRRQPEHGFVELGRALRVLGEIADEVYPGRLYGSGGRHETILSQSVAWINQEPQSAAIVSHKHDS